MSRKLGRNDPCWCGSGRKFKKCHLDRGSESPVPYAAVAASIKTNRATKKCFHPDAPIGCSKVVRAHTLQRAGVLSQIADETNHVLKVGSLSGPVAAIGWKDASTFPGFCSTHDSALFGPIERDPFDGSAHQIFLVGYRSLCNEIFAKESAISGLTGSLHLVDRGRSNKRQREIQEHLGDHIGGAQLGNFDNTSYKEAADEIVRSGQYLRWGGAVFAVKGELSIASAGSATPSFDFNGRRIQDLGDVSRRAQPVMFGIVPGPPGSGLNNIVFSWPPDCPAIDTLMDSFMSLPEDRKADALARFMLAHVENTFFSASWWKSLSELQRSEVNRLAAMVFPEDEKKIISRPKLVDWELVSASVRRAADRCVDR